MTAERLINALKKCDKDAPVHMQLDGSDYGEVEGIVNKGKLFLCTAFEIRKTVPKDVITGEPEQKETVKNGNSKTADTKDKTKD